MKISLLRMPQVKKLKKKFSPLKNLNIMSKKVKKS